MNPEEKLNRKRWRKVEAYMTKKCSAMKIERYEYKDKEKMVRVHGVMEPKGWDGPISQTFLYKDIEADTSINIFDLKKK